MGSERNYVVWNENEEGVGKSLLGYIQIFTEKEATVLKSSEMFVYIVYDVLINSQLVSDNH